MIDKKQAILTIGLLLFFFLLFPLIAVHYEKIFIKWFVIVGAVIFVISEIAKYFYSGKDKAVNACRVVSKVGMIIASLGVALKGLEIIKQKNLYVITNHVKGTDAVVQGIFMIFLAVILSFFIIKYMD